MNSKSLFIVLTLCGLILSALVIRNGRLLVLAMPFLAYLIIGTLQMPVDMGLVAERSIEKPGVVPGEPVKTGITVHNQGSTLINLRLSDTQFPSMATLNGQTWQRILLPAGGCAELNYMFQAGRGVYTWDSIHAIASDSFGLFELKKEIPAWGELIVRPASLSLRSLPLKPRNTLHAAGPISIRLPGSSTDFLGIREYRSGDSLHRLNWRLAARHPRALFTNEYEREEIADFGLILDARKLTDADAVEAALFEESIRVAASLSEAFLKEGNRVALLIFGETMISLFPGYGKRQLNRILGGLARAKLGSNLSLGYLEYLPTRVFPSRSILIVLSSVGTYDHETYARLRSFGYEILLISPDPVHDLGRRLPPTPVGRLAARAARVERIARLKRLMKLGIQVIDWQVDQPFETVIRKAASSVAHRRNI